MGPAEAKIWNKAINAEPRTLKQKEARTKIRNPLESTKGLLSHIVLEIKHNKHGRAKTFKGQVVASDHKQVLARKFENN